MNNGLILGLTYQGVTRLPKGCSYALGHVGTWLAYHLQRDGTSALMENLRVVCPEADTPELKRLALKTYRTYAQDTVDFIRSLSMRREEVEAMLVEPLRDQLEGPLRAGRGVILVGGHFGNWEFGGIVLRVLGGRPLTVIGKPEASPIVGALRRRMRDTLGIETLVIGQMLETALQIRRLLAANEVVAMLLDRHIGRDRVEVEFFGRPTPFLRSPAMIGRLSGAPLLPSFMIRQPDGRFIGSFADPIIVDPRQETEASIRDATQAFATELEGQIRAHPHLWYQFYPYWSKTQVTGLKAQGST